MSDDALSLAVVEVHRFLIDEAEEGRFFDDAKMAAEAFAKSTGRKYSPLSEQIASRLISKHSYQLLRACITDTKTRKLINLAMRQWAGLDTEKPS